MGETLDSDDKDPDPLRDGCQVVFDQLESIGGAEFATTLFKAAFWFGYDGHKRPVVPEGSEPWFLDRLDGARMMLNALIETNTLVRR
jgi:hypothetical protein